MGEARVANRPDAGSPILASGSVAGFLLYLFGLFGTCLIAWWGAGIVALWWTSYGVGFGGLTIAALPYVCAWMILTFRSFPRAVIAALLFPFVMGMTWGLGLIIGFLSFGLLVGILGFVVAAAATGGLVLLCQRFDGPTNLAVWAPIHLLGLGVAGVGLWAAFLGTMNKPFTPESFPRGVAPLAAALLVHALWSWFALRQEGRTRVSPVRVVLMLGGVYLGFGLAYVATAPDRTLPAWPAAPWHDPVLRAREGGGWFAPGETVQLRVAGAVRPFTVPAGWRARPAGWPAIALTMEPMAGVTAGLRNISIQTFDGLDWLPEANGADLSPQTLRARLVRCTAEAPAPAGLMLCRRETAIYPQRNAPDFLPWESLELELVLGPGVSGVSMHSYLAFGRTLQASCLRTVGCGLQLPLSSGGHVGLRISEAELGDWQRIVADVEALLRSAGGLSVIPLRERLPGVP